MVTYLEHPADDLDLTIVRDAESDRVIGRIRNDGERYIASDQRGRVLACSPVFPVCQQRIVRNARMELAFQRGLQGTAGAFDV